MTNKSSVVMINLLIIIMDAPCSGRSRLTDPIISAVPVPVGGITKAEDSAGADLSMPKSMIDEWWFTAFYYWLFKGEFLWLTNLG